MPHGEVVVSIMGLRAALPLVHELRILRIFMLSNGRITSTNQPIS